MKGTIRSRRLAPPPRTFTPNEAAALVDLSAKQVHKEFERGILKSASPPRVCFEDLVYLRALRLMDIEFPVAARVSVRARIVEVLKQTPDAKFVEIAAPLVVMIGPITKDLRDLVARLDRWKRTLVTDADVMTGETVFPGSRVTVRRIGEQLLAGETPDVVREDFPELTDEDLEFAPLFVKAYPRVGRPPEQAAVPRRRGSLAQNRRKPANARSR